MATAIGIRVYMITLHKKGDAELVPFTSANNDALVPRFIDAFKTSHAQSVQDEDRSWYLEEKDVEGSGSSKGYVHYGMSGFESRLIDSATRKKKYDRKRTDSEEVPLFYEFWYPDSSPDFALILFQSFGGRSCMSKIRKSFREEFEKLNPGFSVYIRKLVPGDARSGIFSSHEVRKFTLIRRNLSPDIVTRYIGPGVVESDIELSIKSKPRKSLGRLGDIFKSTQGAGSVLVYDGISFDEAVAEIRLGKRTRKVGVFGSNIDAGVINITDDVETGGNGHPTYESLIEQSNDILSSYYNKIMADEN